jgi:16S rRNA (adenine1518-N6/adenine1519-N6)-dimethyltransferase
LGQHFMVSRDVRERILQEADLGPGCTALEIGPGTGVLTEALLATGAAVIAVEVDAGLAHLLEDALGGRPNLRVWVADALRVDFPSALAPYLGQGPVRVVANIPYCITTPLILRLLEAGPLFDRLCLTLQWEVANRLTASPGTKAYGALTLACEYRASARIILRIPPEAFFPEPAVDSALVRLDCRSAPAVAVRSEAQFFRVIRATFGQRRKTVKNALRHAGWAVEAVESALAAAGIAESRRGETLTLAEFAGVAAALADRAAGADQGARQAAG